MESNIREELLNSARLVKNANTEGFNTANRIGSLFEGIINSIPNLTADGTIDLSKYATRLWVEENFTPKGASGNVEYAEKAGRADAADQADVALKLMTARLIWGKSFDGSADISGDMSGVGKIDFSNGLSMSPFGDGTQKFFMFNNSIAAEGAITCTSSGGDVVPGGSSDIDLSEYALKSWVQANFAPLNHSHDSGGNEIDLSGYAKETWCNEQFALKNHTHTNYLTTTGTAASATKLATSRNLWGQPFNGTADVSGDMTSVGNVTIGEGKMISIKPSDTWATSGWAEVISSFGTIPANGIGFQTIGGENRLSISGYGGVLIGSIMGNGGYGIHMVGVTRHYNNVLPKTSNGQSLGETTCQWNTVHATTFRSNHDNYMKIWQAGNSALQFATADTPRFDIFSNGQGAFYGLLRTGINWYRDPIASDQYLDVNGSASVKTRIYFNNDVNTWMEYDTSNGMFHFSKGIYAEGNISALSGSDGLGSLKVGTLTADTVRLAYGKQLNLGSAVSPASLTAISASYLSLSGASASQIFQVTNFSYINLGSIPVTSGQINAPSIRLGSTTSTAATISPDSATRLKVVINNTTKYITLSNS